jgi:hypothetical protein
MPTDHPVTLNGRISSGGSADKQMIEVILTGRGLTDAYSEVSPRRRRRRPARHRSDASVRR